MHAFNKQAHHRTTHESNAIMQHFACIQPIDLNRIVIHDRQFITHPPWPAIMHVPILLPPQQPPPLSSPLSSASGMQETTSI